MDLGALVGLRAASGFRAALAEVLDPGPLAHQLLDDAPVAALISVFALLLVKPLCYCPSYYIALSVAGIVPLLCGPRLYRWFGGAYIVVALLFAVREQRAPYGHRGVTMATRFAAHRERSLVTRRPAST